MYCTSCYGFQDSGGGGTEKTYDSGCPFYVMSGQDDSLRLIFTDVFPGSCCFSGLFPVSGRNWSGCFDSCHSLETVRRKKRGLSPLGTSGVQVPLCRKHSTLCMGENRRIPCQSRDNNLSVVRTSLVSSACRAFRGCIRYIRQLCSLCRPSSGAGSFAGRPGKLADSGSSAVRAFCQGSRGVRIFCSLRH